jgi:hypothetical protein
LGRPSPEEFVRGSGRRHGVSGFVRRPGQERDRTRLEKKNRGPKYGGFAGELPKKLLRNFPVIFDYGEDGRFLGLTILTLDRARASRRKRRR